MDHRYLSRLLQFLSKSPCLIRAPFISYFHSASFYRDYSNDASAGRWNRATSVIDDIAPRSIVDTARTRGLVYLEASHDFVDTLRTSGEHRDKRFTRLLS